MSYLVKAFRIGKAYDDIPDGFYIALLTKVDYLTKDYLDIEGNVILPNGTTAFVKSENTNMYHCAKKASSLLTALMIPELEMSDFDKLVGRYVGVYIRPNKTGEQKPDIDRFDFIYNTEV